MTTASQTPGPMPAEASRATPGSEALAAAPASPDVPHRLRAPFPEPEMPQCCMCGTGADAKLRPDPRGRRYESGAQVLYCGPCLPPPLPVQAAEGVIAAAMKAGAVTPREIAEAEHAAGIVFDSQAAADIAAAAAEQAHADDAAEIAERGRQLARMAGAVRQRDAVLRLCEGRPGTHLLTVAEVAAAAEYATTPLDAFPMTLVWSPEDGVDIPGPGDSRKRATVKCRTMYGQLAGLIVDGDDRVKLASLVDAEVRDINAPCPTAGCGSADDHDASNPFLAGWARLEFGAMEGGPRWYCSPMCVSDAFARAGQELAAVDQAAAVDPRAQAPALAYDVADDLDARYGIGASDEYAVQVAEAAEADFEAERGDVDQDGAR